MNINRHNYEEYFILYMDNELGSDDRREVEAFVAIHPDLKEELDMLLHTKLTPDQHIVFEGREELMMYSDPSMAINLSNIEEWLVMYVDEELTPEEKTAVEKFAAKHPQVQTEFALLRTTKLQPETIVFADKESLYRKEEKTRRIPAWVRMAAAAVVVAAIGTTVIVISSNSKTPNNQEEIASANPADQKKITTPVNSNATIINNNTATIPVESIAANDPAVITKKGNNTVEKQKQLNVPVLAFKKEEELMANTTNRNNLPQADQNPNVNTSLIADGSNARTNSSISNTLTTSLETINTTTVTDGIVQTSGSVERPTIDKIKDGDGLDEPDGKKNKLRGFFRKVTRTFEKRTNINAADDDDRLLVAGLSIKLK